MRINLLHLAAVAVLITSCVGETVKSEAAVAENELPRSLQNATTSVDLSGYFVDASIIIPDETQGVAHVWVNDFGETHIQVGSLFHVVLAELVEGDLNSFKNRLKEDLLYINEIVEEADDCLLYKSSIANAALATEFHFYCIKTINGVAFEVHDYNEEGGYTESFTRRMLDSVNNLKPNNSSS